ncbi:MAG: hypothetical protein HQM10_06320 [Candidatus Riflebacteria bacterium]|nr:hypothetical protein [Candidatus Riflebacteria bacterium]
MDRKLHLRLVSNKDRIEIPWIICHICDCEIIDTEPYFDVKLEIISGKTRVLDHTKTLPQIEEDIAILTDELENKTSKELEEEVRLERRFCVCPECRKKVLKMLDCE